MNVDTGHLVDPANAEALKKLLEEPGYKEVPEAFREAAAVALKGAKVGPSGDRETFVDLAGSSELAAWARKVRAKRKVRNRMQKKSRRRNRRR